MLEVIDPGPIPSSSSISSCSSSPSAGPVECEYTINVKRLKLVVLLVQDSTLASRQYPLDHYGILHKLMTRTIEVLQCAICQKQSTMHTLII